MAGDLTGLQTAAALAEQIYRRTTEDQQLTDEEIGVEAVNVNNLPSSITPDPNGVPGWYYDYATGFVGRVVTDGAVTYVVFRGTDMSGGLSDAVTDIAANYFHVGTPIKTDVNDFSFANLPLGSGTTERTQLDDAVALAQAAQVAAGDQIVVAVGQSLGGGLAGLVSVLLNLPGIAIAPAPFANQLIVEAQRIAVQAAGLTNVPPDFYGVSPQSAVVRAAENWGQSRFNWRQFTFALGRRPCGRGERNPL
jgi:hypothetical protein